MAENLRQLQVIKSIKFNFFFRGYYGRIVMIGRLDRCVIGSCVQKYRRLKKRHNTCQRKVKCRRFAYTHYQKHITVLYKAQDSFENIYNHMCVFYSQNLYIEGTQFKRERFYGLSHSRSLLHIRTTR